MTREIMVVDDDTDLRTTLQDILIGKGREVVSAKDGFQAIEFASEGNIDRYSWTSGCRAWMELRHS